MGSASSSAAAAADDAILIEPADREAFNVVHVSEDVVRRFARTGRPKPTPDDPGSVELTPPAPSRQRTEPRPPSLEQAPPLPPPDLKLPRKTERTEPKSKPEASSQLIRENFYSASEWPKIEERDPDFRQKATVVVRQRLDDLQNRARTEDAGQFCVGTENRVLNCYKENPKTPLNCSQLAKSFVQCVEVFDQRQNQRAK